MMSEETQGQVVTFQPGISNHEDVYGLQVSVYEDRRVAVLNPTQANLVNYEETLFELSEAVSWLLRSCQGLKASADLQFEEKLFLNRAECLKATEAYRDLLLTASTQPLWKTVWQKIAHVCLGHDSLASQLEAQNTVVQDWVETIDNLEYLQEEFQRTVSRLETALTNFRSKLLADRRLICSSVYSEVQDYREHYTPLEYLLVSDLNKATWKEIWMYFRLNGPEFDQEHISCKSTDLVALYQPIDLTP